MDIKNKKVGVIGTGLMATGIVQLCGMKGYDVRMLARSEQSRDRAMNVITGELDRLVSKDKMSGEDRGAVLKRVKPTLEMSDLSDSDIIIESIIEDLKIKQDLFSRLDTVCPNVRIAATDTAGLPVTRIAEATKKPERIIGIHLLSPVVLSKALELIRPASCSDEVFKLSKEFCETLGKKVLVVKDSPGFIVNRLLTPFVLSAVRLMEEGTATKEDIDAAMRLGTGHPVGPIELLDLAGLKNYCDLADNLYKMLNNKSYIVPDSMRELVKQGNLGRKTGKGFYDWKK